MKALLKVKVKTAVVFALRVFGVSRVMRVCALTPHFLNHISGWMLYALCINTFSGAAVTPEAANSFHFWASLVIS